MQVPAHFTYERATTVEHALALLSQLGPEARVIAGGHSLIPMMKLRLAQPEALVDINDLAELSYVRIDGDELCLGALVRHAELLASPLVGEHFPILRDAERVIADPIVRNRGTVGGSICQADPSEDLSAAFAALRARVVITGPGGARTVPIREFHSGPYETAVAAGELLTEIRVPIRPSAARGASEASPAVASKDRLAGSSAYEKVERRVGDWPVAAAGAAIWFDNGTIADVGIGLTAVGAHQFAAPEAEEHLRGTPGTDDAFAEAGRIAAEHCDPVTDQRGPADYKRHLAAELTKRALRRAARRARGNGQEV
jgi:aerobic carbon-monoxide dehydrogenase medium subunit